MTRILTHTKKITAIALATLFLSVPFVSTVSAAEQITPDTAIALSKGDDGSWHKGKYEGRGTGHDDGSWYEGKYDKDKRHDKWDKHENNGRRFECDRCGRDFHDRSELKKHYEKRHSRHDWKDGKDHDRHDRDWDRDRHDRDWDRDRHDRDWWRHDRDWDHDRHDRDKKDAVTGFILGAVTGAIIANNT